MSELFIPMDFNTRIVTTVILGIGLLFAVNFLQFGYSEKNPQADCINNQNGLLIGNEQKGDAYKSSKDTCQSLSK